MPTCGELPILCGKLLGYEFFKNLEDASCGIYLFQVIKSVICDYFEDQNDYKLQFLDKSQNGIFLLKQYFILKLTKKIQKCIASQK
jgi:hypothetical protein